MKRAIAGKGGPTPYSDGKVADGTTTSTPKPSAAHREVDDGSPDATSSGVGGTASVLSTSSAGTRWISGDLSSFTLAEEEPVVNGKHHGSPDDPPEAAEADRGFSLPLLAESRTGVLGGEVRSEADRGFSSPLLADLRTGVLCGKGKSPSTRGDGARDQGTTDEKQGCEFQQNRSSPDKMIVDITNNNQSSKPSPSEHASLTSHQHPFPTKPPMVAPISCTQSMDIGELGSTHPSPFIPQITSPLLSSTKYPTDPSVTTYFNSELLFPLQDFGLQRIQIWEEELWNLGILKRDGEQPTPAPTSIQEMMAHLTAGMRLRIRSHSDAVDPNGKGKQIVEDPANGIFDYDSSDDLSEEELDDDTEEGDYSAVADLLRGGQRKQREQPQPFFPDEADRTPPKGNGKLDMTQTFADGAPPKWNGKPDMMQTFADRAPPEENGKLDPTQTFCCNFEVGSTPKDQSSEADPTYFDNENCGTKHLQGEACDDFWPKRQRLNSEEERLAEINSQWKDQMEKLGTPYDTGHPSSDDLRKSREDHNSDNLTPEDESGGKGNNPSSK